MKSDELFTGKEFPDKTSDSSKRDRETWKILIADDHEEIHTVSQMVLEDFVFQGKTLKILNAFSEDETKEIIKKNPDIALLFLDVFMNGKNSGLDIVQYIRDELKNSFIRIILRTGQAWNAPENKIIVEYDINDYKEKTELTEQKLKTAVVTALRAYRDLRIIENNQKKLTKANLYLDQIINSISSLLIAVDRDFIINIWNDVAEKETGVKKTTAIGKNLWDITSISKDLKNKFVEVMNTGKLKISHGIHFFDREQRFRNVFIYPLNSPENTGIVLKVDDITDIKKKDEQLIQSQKLEAVGSLAAGLAHDINNILCGITGAVSLLEFDIPDMKTNEQLTTIKGSANMASELVNKLLTLSRKSTLNVVAFDLNDSIRNVVQICESSFDKNIKIIEKFYKEPANVLADPIQIEQILLNLCINAAHAMTIMRTANEPGGGTLTVQLELFSADMKFCFTHPKAKPQYYWILSVSDTGIGMDEKTVSKIFDPFFTTKKDGRGTGLGLSIAYNIIHQFKGFIDVVSEPNKGSTIMVYLPYSEKEAFQTKKEVKIKKSRRVANNELILLCDDEELMRNVGERMLKKCGYSVILAENGYESVKTFRKWHKKIDGVILDLLMPGLSGVEVFKEMKKIDPNVKVMLSSGYNKNERVMEALNKGVKYFLQKPYTLQSLVDSLSLMFGNTCK